MPARGASRRRTLHKTKLAEARLARDLTQAQVAHFTGIPLTTYRKLERGDNKNPPLRWLVNLQHVLVLDDVRDLIEDEWLEFKQLRPKAPKRPPDPNIIRSRPPAVDSDGT